ncbi:aldehyde reductase [Hyphobacterium sp. SN044]|uniref:SDR family oxidoreductase n=1 Tax=Hyphobacterium sp. SN044 TaxID=2912575 RepID=UPI001F1C0D65|nr:aldehyde reductase [Hyphobacterium sp. SN044]MCF8880356.1 aldehyde reductase [Hyphobacterium sp. SN044]
MADRVLVTGATGFLGQHCILQLIAAGYEVRGTVRSLTREAEVRYALRRGEADNTKLTLVEADLSADAGWDAAVAGCTSVMHVASPFPLSQPQDDDELIRPARDGALRVLKAAAKAGVKRTVMTSSVAAVSAGHDKSGRRVFDENDWSDLDGPNVSAYEKSKTLAERAAWDFIASPEAKGMELSVINPGAILGPALTADMSTSLEIVRQLMARALPACPRIGFPVVDVRDVAAAHLAAMTTPEAAGKRYICTEKQAWFSEIAKVLDARYGPEGWKIPTGELPGFVVRIVALFNPTVRSILPSLGVERRFDTSRIRTDLNWQPCGMEAMSLASADSLIELGVVTKP